MDFNLFQIFYIIQVFKILLSNPSHFILSLCQPPISILYSAATPPFLHLHYSLPSKTISYFHSHFDSSSFQTVHLLAFFFMIYAPFNLSLFFSVSLHTSFFFLFIASCQHLSSSLFSPNSSFYFIAPPHTLWALSPHFPLFTFLLHFQPFPVLSAPTYTLHCFLHPIQLSPLKET